MSLEFDCPQCGRKIRAPEALAGQKARCPQCQGVVDVPGAEPLIQATIPVVPVQPSFTPGPAPAGGQLHDRPGDGEARSDAHVGPLTVGRARALERHGHARLDRRVRRVRGTGGAVGRLDSGQREERPGHRLRRVSRG